MSNKPIEVNDESVFRYLGANPTALSLRGKKGRPTKKATWAAEFLSEFGIEALHEALINGNEKITLKWYVTELLKLLRSPADVCNSNTKLQILRELKQLVVMGAIQDLEFNTHIATKEAKAAPRPAEKTPDPFANLKVS